MQHSRGCLQHSLSSWLGEMATPCPIGPLGQIGWQIWRSLNKTSALAGAGSLQNRAAKTRGKHVHVYMRHGCFSFKITLHHDTSVLQLISSIRGLTRWVYKAWKLFLQTCSNILNTLKQYYMLSVWFQGEVTKENWKCGIEQIIVLYVKRMYVLHLTRSKRGGLRGW